MAEPVARATILLRNLDHLHVLTKLHSCPCLGIGKRGRIVRTKLYRVRWIVTASYPLRTVVIGAEVRYREELVGSCKHLLSSTSAVILNSCVGKE